MAWMLQGNPARFALRAYLQSPVLYWLVNRYQAEFALADHLFVWESGPDGGVVAYGHVIELPTKRRAVTMPHYLFDELWLDAVPDPDAVVVGVRVLLTIHEGFGVPRDVARTHPVLATLDVLRMPQATVYRCTPAQVVALTENYNTQ